MRTVVDDVRDFFEEARRCERMSRDRQRQIDMMREDVSGLRAIDYTRPVVQVSPTADAIENARARLEELEERQREFIRGHAEHIASAYEVMHSCSLGGYGYAVCRHHLFGEPWAKVAADEFVLHSERMIYRHLMEGYEEVHALLPAEWRSAKVGSEWQCPPVV